MSRSYVSTTDLGGFVAHGRTAEWERISRRAYVRVGWSDAYGYLLVATGRIELMLDPAMHPWDAGPFPPIFREAGGYYGDWSGNETIYNFTNNPNNFPFAQFNPFTETPDQMVRRVCRELGAKKNIVVINDEAHHCYRHRAGGVEEQLTGDARKEAAKRDEAAHRLARPLHFLVRLVDGQQRTRALADGDVVRRAVGRADLPRHVRHRPREHLQVVRQGRRHEHERQVHAAALEVVDPGVCAVQEVEAEWRSWCEVAGAVGRFEVGELEHVDALQLPLPLLGDHGDGRHAPLLTRSRSAEIPSAPRRWR